MRKTPLVLSACALALGVLAGCGDGSTAGGAPTTPATTAAPSKTPPKTPAKAPDTTGTVIDATVRGNDLEPNGERIKVKVGEPITINMDADRPGQLHVHSVPEQTLQFAAGTSTLELTITTPGVVEVEEHEADKVLVSLEAS